MLTTEQRAARGAANHQPHAEPDWATLATQAVEALWVKPREKWQAGGDEHKAVTRILKGWAKARGSDVDAERAESERRMSVGRVATVYAERECERCGRDFKPKGPSAKFCHRRNCAEAAATRWAAA